MVPTEQIPVLRSPPLMHRVLVLREEGERSSDEISNSGI